MTAVPWRRRLAGVLVGLVLAATAAVAAAAHPLRALLPADAVLVLGVEGGADASEVLTPLLDAWEATGLGEALRGLVGDDLGALDTANQLDAWSLLGEAAYLVVSVNPFNPFPALTLIAAVDGATGARVSERLAADAAASGAQAQREGAIDFVLFGPELFGWPFAAVHDGELLALSSNPDTLRALLRQRQGTSEPNLLRSPGGLATLSDLESGVLLGYLDPGGLARALNPFASGLGFDRTVQRLQQVARTSGPIAGVALLSDAALVTRSLQRIDGERGDAALQALLRSTPPLQSVAFADALAALPDSALRVSVQASDPQAWWRYLGDLARELPELGVPDLNRTLRDLLGVDLGTAVFGWTLPGVVSVAMPGSAGPAGQVIGLRTRDEAAARRGLASLTTELGVRLALFSGAFGALAGAPAGAPAARASTVAGVEVRSLDLAPGLTLATAVHAGWAWFATSEAALAALLEAQPAGATRLASALTLAPSDAHALTSNRAAGTLPGGLNLLPGIAPLLSTALAELAEPERLQGVEQALSEFLSAIAPLFGEGLGWTRLDGEGRIERFSSTALNLR